jgi:lipopolysaccharide transport system permease protein
MSKPTSGQGARPRRASPIAAMANGLVTEWRPAARLARRSYALRYRNSRFGLFWEFLDPLAIAAIFILLYSFRGISVNPVGFSYAMFVISGLMLWQSFADGLSTGERSILAQKPLLSAVKVAPELIVLSNVYLVLFSTTIRLVIAVVAIVALGQVSFPGLLGYVGLGYLLALFGAGLGLILAPFATVVGDVRFAVRIVTRLGMFLSSVIFPLPVGHAVVDWFRAVNPMAVLIENARSLAGLGALIDQPAVFAAYVGVGLITFLIGWYVVHVTLPVVGDQ